MRLLLIDIDTLRPDHLGCYGYARPTSPVIDDLAARGLRFEHCHASDVPCLPSRTALMTGTFGTRNGVVSHGGTAADLRSDGADRGFQSSWSTRSWMGRFRNAGYHTATVSSFAERHSAWQWHMGFRETINPGLLGLETADAVTALADEWLVRRGERDDWVLHVHLWDPHTPYRTPLEFGDPLASSISASAGGWGWLDEPRRLDRWGLPGPHSAQELLGFEPDEWGVGRVFPRQPLAADSMEAVARMLDGYDTGIRYADQHVGLLLERLDALNVLDETAVVVTGDHGENFGELGYFCDHQSADEPTTRVPMVMAWPDVQPGVVTSLHYQFDVAATILELAGGRPSRRWDAESFADELPGGAANVEGRDHLVVTQGAWSAQRGVRWGEWLYLHTRHDGFHGWPAEMLFDLADDPHEEQDVLAARPEIASEGRRLLAAWLDEQTDGGRLVDPLDTVMDEGGPWHVRGHQEAYAGRLRDTGREAWADWFAHRPEPVGRP